MNIIITKFEKTYLIGVRATQLSDGAPPLINCEGMINAMDIAEEEFNQRIIPLKLQRTMPNGTIVELSIKNMICPRQ